MKFFIVIDKDNFVFIENLGIIYPSSLDKYGYFSLCLIDIKDIDDFLALLINSNTRVRFLNMWVSGEKPDTKIRDSIRLEERVLDSLMYCDTYNKKGFYNLGLILNEGVVEAKLNGIIRYANSKLEENNLLLKERAFVPTLMDLFVESLRMTSLEGINQYEEKIKDDIDFQEDVIATFLLKASNFYKKEDIKVFLERRLL